MKAIKVEAEIELPIFRVIVINQTIAIAVMIIKVLFFSLSESISL